jgi:hypothetical protein
MAVFVTDAPGKCIQTICPLSKLDKSPIFWFFHMNYHSAQSLAITRITSALTQALSSTIYCKQMEEHSVLPIEFLSM